MPESDSAYAATAIRQASNLLPHIAGLNLLTAIIIYWNTKQLGFAVAQRRKAGLETPVYLLSHISLLGWAHIILTGEYRWRKMKAGNL